MRRLPFFLPATFASALLLLVTPGCDLFGSEDLPFSWFTPGTRFTYDYDDAVDGSADGGSAFEIEVVEPETGYAALQVLLRSRKSLPDAAYPILDGLTQMVSPPERSEEGIRIGYYTRCETPPINLGNAEMALWIPAEPTVGETYRHYKCERRVDTAHEAVAVDTSITVLAGTFETFVLQTRNLQRTYWNEPTGLIQVERFDHESGRLIGTFKLRWSLLSSDEN